MSRKDYVKIAAILADTPLDPTIRYNLALQFAVLFEEDNPFFDRERFYDAAGVIF